jgi:hypothetical protein
VRPTAPTRPAAPVTRMGFAMFFPPAGSPTRKSDFYSQVESFVHGLYFLAGKAEASPVL